MKKKMVANTCTELFYQMIRSVIGTSDERLENPLPEVWKGLYEMTQQQSLLGILFYGIEKHPEMRPPRELLLKWYAVSEQIRRANEKTNRVAVELSDYFRSQGFRSCILKGQGNTLNYPDSYIRTSGDIDVWLSPISLPQGEEVTRRNDKGKKLSVDENVKEVLAFVRKQVGQTKMCYHHVDFKAVDGIEVEVHYRPSFMNNLIHNSRLQKWFEKNADEQFSHEVELPDGAGKICVPTDAFNRIYQLAHINQHVINGGIGLRQIIDYYLVLKQEMTDEERVHDERLLKHLGLYKVASALMWVLKETLGLDEKYWLVAPNEKVGQFLLEEIMLSGNFGQYDQRVKHGASPWEKNLQRLQRDWRLMWYFPSECLWEPIFRWYHFFWRLAHR